MATVWSLNQEIDADNHYSSLAELVDEHDLRGGERVYTANKQRGQHGLIFANVMERIVTEAELRELERH